jgi:hypothetical protein
MRLFVTMIVIFRSSDILAIWEECMADISQGLKDKYGLRERPSQEQINRWIAETERRIRDGFGREDSGENAARLIFPDFKALAQRSDADTIAELLETARKK